ncbi:MAG: DUF4062 domain-containing protein [Verrucomicrobiaceae bacterium]|nr:DUF4062 domain-containing protein [Verrucomicrobiaceae bacterium]
MTAPTSASHKPGQITAMISSTAIDLPLHRKAVKDACIDAGVFPIGMESLPAQDQTGVKVSLDMVDKADLYIGIYAWRYGWVPAGGDKSITEMELDHAVKRKSEDKLKELLIFIAADDHAFTAKDIEADAEAQKKLKAFKNRACDGRVRKTFASVEELRRLVSEALLHHIERVPAVLPRTAIPHNLPRLQPFFGREKELAHIRQALDPENRTWGALIDGPGGMGKTSLAVRAALECTPEQFERIVFVSIKQRELDDDGVRDLSLGRIDGVLEMLNEIARELGHADITKSAENERARLVLEALRPTRTLLVLDNLESLARGDRDHIFTFVKRLPQGCKAILTSRGRIGSGSEELILEKLDEQAALDTLADLARHNPDLAKTSEAERMVLYRETGGKPLLLRWTAGQIGRGHCRTFTDAIDFLRSCPPGNDPLEFIFGDLVQDFTPEETQALCALSHFTLPAKVEHIALLIDDKEKRFSSAGNQRLETAVPWLTRALKSLINRSLVVPDAEEQHYTLVPLVADFLRVAKPELIGEAGQRLEDRAFALALENGWDNHERFPLIDAAWPALAAALPRFLSGPNDRLQELCNAFQHVLHFQGRWDEWQALVQSAEARALATQDHGKAGWRAYDSGFVYYQRGQAAEVLACAERAARHWTQAQAGAREQAIAIRLRGIGHELTEDYHAAITAYREAMALHRSAQPENEGIAICLNDIAEAERRSGELEAAEADYLEALRIAQTVGHREGVAMYIGNLALLALNRRDWTQAEALARQALPLAEQLGRLDLIGAHSHHLALALLRQGRAAEGLPLADRAVEIFEKLADRELAEAQQLLRESREAV